MRIAVHDYAGHPFQVQLSAELARRGHEVFHLYCSSLAGPQAAFDRYADVEGLTVVPVAAPADIDKGSIVSRLRNEYAYGRRIRRILELSGPDVVVSANAPTHVQAQVQGLRGRSPWANVLWLQDLYGVAIRSVYARRSNLAGTALAAPFTSTDRRLIAAADQVVVISEGFLPHLGDIDAEKVTVIHNWAPIEDLPEVPKDNEWSRGRDLADGFTFLYAGTLGMKHDPELLVALAEEYADDPDTSVVVVGSGVGMDWLRTEAAARGLDRLHLSDPVDFDLLPSVLGAADVLVVLLEPDAGEFSVPSKVLSYLCAGRAILGALPSQNLAADILQEARAGVTVDPGDRASFIEAARRLRTDDVTRGEMAANARAYAERTFDIETVADAWEGILARIPSG